MRAPPASPNPVVREGLAVVEKGLMVVERRELTVVERLR